MISRRYFLSSAAKCGAGAGIGLSELFRTVAFAEAHAAGIAGDRLKDIIQAAPKARYWVSTASAGPEGCLECHETKDNLSDLSHHGKEVIVKCRLCSRNCTISPGDRGLCRARINVDGELRSLVYGRPITMQIDPIEKKPFNHFLPGSSAFSLATSGCPLRCKFCQNWEISQSRPEDYESRFISPDTIVNSAVSQDAPVIAFTYNEPTVFTEYLVDIARAGRIRRRRPVMISCGFMNSDPLTEMCEVLDAIKIDLKGFDEGFYRSVCSAELRPVLNSIKQIAKSGTHLELVNLVVPTLNDSEKMFRSLVDWVGGEIGPDVPIHFTRFHPDYQLTNLPATPVAKLEQAREIALGKGIHYPYIGNVPGHPGNHTYCPSCGKVVIKRKGFFIEEMNLKSGHCRFCGAAIAGVWS